MPFDARRWMLSWLLAAPLTALAWPLATEVATSLGWSTLVAVALARAAAGLGLRAASALAPERGRAAEARKLHPGAAPRFSR